MFPNRSWTTTDVRRIDLDWRSSLRDLLPWPTRDRRPTIESYEHAGSVAYLR